jgi:hypothetical protein
MLLENEKYKMAVADINKYTRAVIRPVKVPGGNLYGYKIRFEPGDDLDSKASTQEILCDKAVVVLGKNYAGQIYLHTCYNI